MITASKLRSAIVFSFPALASGCLHLVRVLPIGLMGFATINTKIAHKDINLKSVIFDYILQKYMIPSLHCQGRERLGSSRFWLTPILSQPFPFGLPCVLVEVNRWEEFVLSFSNRYPGPKEFRDICWIAAGNRELKRDTDKVSQTPFSLYNRRLYRQTYYGIRDVLAPLARNQLACVLPCKERHRTSRGFSRSALRLH
jgi:hypothetical protein